MDIDNNKKPYGLQHCQKISIFVAKEKTIHLLSSF